MAPTPIHHQELRHYPFPYLSHRRRPPHPPAPPAPSKHRAHQAHPLHSIHLSRSTNEPNHHHLPRSHFNSSSSSSNNNNPQAQSQVQQPPPQWLLRRPHANGTPRACTQTLPPRWRRQPLSVLRCRARGVSCHLSAVAWLEGGSVVQARQSSICEIWCRSALLR